MQLDKESDHANEHNLDNDRLDYPNYQSVWDMNENNLRAHFDLLRTLTFMFALDLVMQWKYI